MKQFAKEVVRTLVVTLVILLIFGIVFFSKSAILKTKGNFERLDLSRKDPTVEILYDRVKNKTTFRKASLDKDTFNSLDIITAKLDNLKKNEIKNANYKLDAGICVINNKIMFNSDRTCEIMILDNSIFDDYQKEIFNTSKKLDYPSFKYKGMECKSDGKKYYCLQNKFNDSLRGYSYLDSAFKINDEIHIREYYLQIDTKEKNRCSKYIGSTYCNNPQGDVPTIGNEIIKNDGTLYEHIFKKDHGKYYLVSSKVVS